MPAGTKRSKVEARAFAAAASIARRHRELVVGGAARQPLIAYVDASVLLRRRSWPDQCAEGMAFGWMPTHDAALGLAATASGLHVIGL